MSRKSMIVGLVLMGTAVGGCEVVAQALGILSDLNVLGVMPADGFADPNSSDYGKVKLALGAEDEDGWGIAPLLDDIDVEADDGQDIEVGDWEEVEGFEQGSFVLLVDGSGSVEADLTCDNCPTDPGRLRVEAAKALATELAACSGDWRMSLMEFGNSNPDAGFSATATLADWTTDPMDIQAAADGLSSYARTPLWDSVHEVLDVVADDVVETFGEDSSQAPADVNNAGTGLVVLSDGADTESSRVLADVVAKATSLGLAVHTVGFGPASDSADGADNAAVQDLRELAEQTGGYYGYVDSVDDLPELTEAIAKAQCGGYSEMEVVFTEPAESGEDVSGSISLKGAPISVPFRFRAP